MEKIWQFYPKFPEKILEENSDKNQLSYNFFIIAALKPKRTLLGFLIWLV